MIRIATIAGSDASGGAGLEADPVMVCKGAREALNPAEQLSCIKEIAGIEQMKEAARIIHGKGARHVFIKGGAKLREALL